MGEYNLLNPLMSSCDNEEFFLDCTVIGKTDCPAKIGQYRLPNSRSAILVIRKTEVGLIFWIKRSPSFQSGLPGSESLRVC